jgi:cytochrome c-type biogenesis protein CcsB
MTVGDISTMLVWGAMTAFTIGFLAYTADLARIAEAASRAARLPVSERELAEIGATASSGARPSAPATRPASDAAGTGAVPAAGRSRRAEGISRSTTYLGVLLLLAGIVARGIAAGRWPTANMYEFTLVGAFVAVTVLAVVQRTRYIPFLGVVVHGIAVLALALALLVFYVQADAVQPALQSYWLVLHVGVAISATGVFTVAFAAAVLQVLKAAREAGRSRLDAPWQRFEPVRAGLQRWRVTGPAWEWLRSVPSARELEALSFRLNSIGFVLWTFTLIGGAIWAEHAWGRYWGWDPKEVGTFIAWVVYAAYLHARTTRGWSGSRAAYFVFVGYGVVLANFTVINLFVTGKHSYSGL